MKQLINLLLFAVTLTTMSACFEITEEVTINKDGSGGYTSIIDASKLSEQMQMLAAFDTTGEMIPKLKYSLDSTFAESFKKYSKVKGISKLVVDTSKTYIYKVSMIFKDIATLNEVLNIDKKDDSMKNLYSWKKGNLTRKDIALNLDELKMEDDSQKEMAKSFLEGMKYTIILNMPGKVKKMTNKEAKLSDDKKKITLECSLLDIIDKKAQLGNEISYK
ncbi:MAG: hypothetical protein JNL70_17950 [Saprospiraceae bacterium]|nr:hypothetical protein [Saprospiraceae bacterium]